VTVVIAPERVEEIAAALVSSFGRAVEADDDAPRIVLWHLRGGTLGEIAFPDDGGVAVDLLDGTWLEPLAGRALSVRTTEDIEKIAAAIVDAVGELLDEVERIRLVVDGDMETSLLGFLGANREGLDADAVSGVCRLAVGEEYRAGVVATASWTVRRVR